MRDTLLQSDETIRRERSLGPLHHQHCPYRGKDEKHLYQNIETMLITTAKNEALGKVFGHSIERCTQPASFVEAFNHRAMN